jgi:hypothetical protein
VGLEIDSIVGIRIDVLVAGHGSVPLWLLTLPLEPTQTGSL